VSAQLRAALLRAVIGGIFVAGAAFFTALGATDATVVKALIPAGSAFFSYVVARGLGEGQYDTSRDQSGNVKPGDVGPEPTTGGGAR
jgi:hypothetical protein